jgi:hypothetical protein
MRRNSPISSVFLIWLCVTGANAATLFSDDFQDAATSKAKWHFPDSVTSAYSNGAVTLSNKDSKYMWFVTHSMPAKKATFTLSATITLTSSASDGVGLVCCNTNDTSGIFVELGKLQNLYAKKFSLSGQPEVLNVFNSFISTSRNVITISKKESVFTIICNNNLIGNFIVTDPLFAAGGDIGVVLPPKSSATFDNFIMTDDPTTGYVKSCFADDFNDADITGWYTYLINGTYQSGGGKFAVSNADAQYSGLLYVNGDFKRSSIKVITSFQGGNGPYGCMLVYTTPTAQGNFYKTFSFVIDSTQRYGVSDPDSSAIRMSLPKTFIHGGTAGAKDTLEVRKYDNRYAFIINGTVVENELPIPAPAPDAAGLTTGPKTSVAYEKFAVGGDSSGASCAVLLASTNSVKRFTPLLRLPANGFSAIDALGRISKRFGDSNNESIRRCASGIYFLKPPINGGSTMPINVVK